MAQFMPFLPGAAAHWPMEEGPGWWDPAAPHLAPHLRPGHPLEPFKGGRCDGQWVPGVLKLSWVALQENRTASPCFLLGINPKASLASAGAVIAGAGLMSCVLLKNPLS